MTDAAANRPTLLVLASTYPRWRDDPEPGFVHELCKRLAVRFRVIAVVPDAPGADPSGELEGVEVVRYRYAPRRWQRLVNDGGIVTNLKRSPWMWMLVPGFIFSQYLAAGRLMKHRSIDVIHAHWLIPQGLVARRLCRHLPYVVTSHGGDLFGLRGRLLTAIKRRVAKDAAALTVVSSAMREECERLDIRPRRITVLPMGVDLSVRFTATDDAAREPDRMLFVGRLVPKKGLRHLLDALPLILRERPQAKLDIAGFGPEEPALRAQAQRLGIEECVRFLGALPQPELPTLYRKAAVFVAPFIRDASGNQEGLPVALMEALGCGCPVVVGRVAGVEDLLGEAARELAVDPTDPQALAHAVLRTLADPEQARQQARDVFQGAASRVNWSNVAAGYTNVLLEAMETQAPPEASAQ
ncbi:MAG TPA: glycosyltransferase [Xanthomonadaceae bacterium]|nr:glycosyltransferase [Xanthomonadaceae bacterium]